MVPGPDLVGTAAVEALRRFLGDWPRGSKRAALVSGPTGVGKTRAVHMACAELGLDPVCFDASHPRTSRHVANLAELCAGAVTVRGRRACLVFDEVDGMGAGDRGGLGDLVRLTESSRVPIVAVCTDKHAPKLRSLRAKCVDISCSAPPAEVIARLVSERCDRLGVAAEPSVVAALATGCMGDVRLALNQARFLGLAASKDRAVGPFDAAHALMRTGPGSLSDRLDLVFQDADMVPLLVFENYVGARPALARDDATRLRVLAKAADALSCGDTIGRAVRQRQDWALAPFAAVMSAVYPATYVREPCPGYPRFPAWLGKNSTFTKNTRLLGELHARTKLGRTASIPALRLDCLDPLRRSLTQPLVRDGKAGVGAVASVMAAYRLAKEHLDTISGVLLGQAPKVDPRVKAALTRALRTSAGTRGG